MKTHLTFPPKSCSSAFRAGRVSPKIRRVWKGSWAGTRGAPGDERSGSSMRMRGSSFGRSSLPIHVSSSFCLRFIWLSATVSHDAPRHTEKAFARYLLRELRFKLRNQGAALAVDLVLRLEERPTTGVA